VNPDEVEVTGHETIRGVDVATSVSVYDTPEAVRGSYDAETKKLTLDFKYLGGPERLIYEQPKNDIALGIGRTSHRLHHVEIIIDSGTTLEETKGAEAIERIENLLKEYVNSTTPRNVSAGSFLAASGVVQHERNRILASVVNGNASPRNSDSNDVAE